MAKLEATVRIVDPRKAMEYAVALKALESIAEDLEPKPWALGSKPYVTAKRALELTDGGECRICGALPGYETLCSSCADKPSP